MAHIERRTPSGARVLVLDTGAAIGPEAQAMLAALHSRSIGGIASHLKVLRERGAARFMETYYVGYGHKSIGDLGSATVFIEGVSLLAAKAVQHWPLYNGQESSTRYIDFSTQPMINPLGTPEGEELLETWRAFYAEAQEPTRAWVREQFPRSLDEPEKRYEKAVAARTFDILRGFLPAGTATNLAWHGTLRQFADALLPLRHHPLPEAREVAHAVWEALEEAFPHSFSHHTHTATEAYWEATQSHSGYLAPDAWEVGPEVVHDGIDRIELASLHSMLEQRPPKTELPYRVALAGILRIRGLLDFGSWRDLQRHRAVHQAFPLLTPTFGFHPWYLEMLPPALRTRAESLIRMQEHQIRTLELAPPLRQYYLPLGYRVPVLLAGDLRALTYLVELRATRFVHPTLRRFARDLATLLHELFSEYGLVLHLDNEPDRFDTKRGEHDIVMRDVDS